MRKNTSIDGVVDNFVDELSILRNQIENKERNIQKYENQIRNLQDYGIRRKKELERFEKTMDREAKSMENDSSVFKNNLRIENNIFNSNIANESLLKEANEQKLSNVQRQTNNMRQDVLALLSRIEKTSQQLNEVIEKKSKIDEILLEEEKSKQTLEEAHQLHTTITNNESETNYYLLQIYQEIIILLQKKIEKENYVHSEVVKKYQEEISSFHPEEYDVDDFEIRLIQRQISSKSSKFKQIESIEQEYEEKINEMQQKLQEKKKIVKQQQHYVKQSQQRCDSVTDCIICPNYYTKIAQMVCETQSRIKKCNKLKQDRDTQNKIIKDELYEKKKLLRLFDKAMGKEDEKRLNYLSQINKLDTQLIQLNAKENIEEMFYEENIKEMNRILKRKHFLEEEFNSMLTEFQKISVKEKRSTQNGFAQKTQKENSQTYSNTFLIVQGKKNELIPFNHLTIKKLKKQKKEIEKEKIQLLTKIKLKIDDVNTMNFQIKDCRMKLLKLPKEKEEKRLHPLQLYDNPTFEEIIESKKRNIEKRRKKLHEKEERLTRVEFVNGIFDHKTPLIFTDTERVCDRLKQRKERIQSCLDKEENFKENVSTLFKFYQRITHQMEELKSGKSMNFSDDGEQWFDELTNYLPKVC